MANTYTTLNELFTAIADAIRAKKQTTDVIVADAFPAEIENLRSGFDYVNHEITTIPDYGFYGCEALDNVNCYSLTSVGAKAFKDCKNLKTIILYSGVQNVGENAFKGCDGVTIYCEASDRPENWHQNWNPDNCEVIWGYAPVETWNVGAAVFNVCASLYRDILAEDRYTLIIFGTGVMESYWQIDMPWHSQCHNIENVVIQSGVTTIGYATFYNCRNLTSVTIPDSVTTIGGCAFEDCDNLMSIVYAGTIAQWDAITLGSDWNSNTGNYTIHCADGDIAKDGTITYN